MADRDAMVKLLDETLRTGEIEDSSCNGLQVEGSGEVRRVGLAVDACMQAYERAVDAGCQMLVVHHGLIWTGIRSVTGRYARHIRYLFDNALNLYGSHLPLDLHPQLGNNAGLARAAGLGDVSEFGDYHGLAIGLRGELDRPTPLRELADRVAGELGGPSMILPHGAETVRTVGIVSGGAGRILAQAADAGLDCYLTGEPDHANFQLSRDLGISVIYLGHYHSEQLGVRAIGRLLGEKFGVESVLVDIDALTARDYID